MVVMQHMQFLLELRKAEKYRENAFVQKHKTCFVQMFLYACRMIKSLQ